MTNLGKETWLVAPKTMYREENDRLIPGLTESQNEKVWPEPMSGCWLWSGSLINGGYPKIWVGTKFKNGKRSENFIAGNKLVYTLTHGPLAKGHVVWHRCGNRSCVNPDHLMAGTRSESLTFQKKQPWYKVPQGVVLTPEKVREAHAMFDRGDKVKDIARHFKVSKATMTQALYGESWKHVVKGKKKRRPRRDYAAEYKPEPYKSRWDFSDDEDLEPREVSAQVREFVSSLREPEKKMARKPKGESKICYGRKFE